MIAVTGANGLLGNQIVRTLLDQGERVVALRRKNSDTSLLADIEDQIEWKEADVTDELSLLDGFKGAKAVIHAAASVSFKRSERQQIFDINVTGTKNVVDACLALGIERLLHVSSIAALGRPTTANIINEKNKWTSSPLNSIYAESKYLAELEVFRGQEEGLRTIMINPTVILGPGDWNKSSSQLFKYVAQQKNFYIDGTLNYIDARDAASIVYQLLTSDIEGERFVVSAGHIEYLDFFKKLGDSLNRKPPSIKINKTILKTLAILEDARSQLTGSTPLITRETARMAGKSFIYDNQKIKKRLNFEFQSIEMTLAWCSTYYIAKMSNKN